MKNLNIVLLILLTVLLTNCRKEETLNPIDENDDGVKSFFVIPEEDIGSSRLEGIVTDQNGEPLADATVQFGSESVQTNGQGYYYLNKVSNGEDKPIYFLKDGFMMTQKLAAISQDRISRIDAALYPVEVSEQVNIDGKTISYEDFEIEIPEGAYTEKVTVKATAYRITDDNFDEAFPGDFEGQREDNSVVPIESFGFINVEVSNSKGFVDPELPVTLKVKAPEDSPSSIPMWYYDFVEKKWIEEGSWDLVDGYFIGEVNHFTPWNVDVPRDPPRSQVFGRVIDQNGTPLEDALVVLSGISNRVRSQAYTNEDGEFSFTTLRNLEFEINASWSFYYPTQVTISTSGDDNSQVNVGDIIINVADQNEAEPLITNELVQMLPGENVIIRGNFFGNEFMTNYKVLIDDEPVEVLKLWSNTEIQFDAPFWINDTGTIKILRGNKESNEVEYEIPNELWTIFTTNNSIVGRFDIPSITETSNGEILFGTHGNGILSYIDGQFENYIIPNQNNVNIEDLNFDNENALLISTWDGFIKRNSDESLDFLSTQNPLLTDCWSSCVDLDGNIWVASLTNGLFQINEDEIINYNSSNSDLGSNSIRTVYFSDRTNTLWIGSMDNGLISYSGSEFTVYNPSNSNISDNTIFDIIEDRDGALWLATRDGGLVKFDNGVFSNWKTSNSSLSHNDIYRLANGNDGSIWIGTWGGGLFNFDRNDTFVNWNASNSELLDGRISALYQSTDGSVWIGMYQTGIAKLNFREQLNP